MESGYIIREQSSLEKELEGYDRSSSFIDRVVDFFRRKSIFVLAYGTGCGAVEMPPTFTSRYDAERFGISGAATPRQADVIIVSGYLSYKTLRRVIRTYEQMSSPKYVIALGSCTINGGMYWDSYNTVKRLDLYLPVDVYANGCMPRPESILDAFIALQKRIEYGEEKGGWERYIENIDYYRENQRAVLGDDIHPAYEADWYSSGGVL
jgi:NADH-quinone oxidoreductase subunit B